MPRFVTFVPVSAIFPEVRPDFATFCRLVRGLSRTDALFWCARLNLILSNPENHNQIGKQGYGVRLFFDHEQIGRLNQFTTEHGGAEVVAVFLRAQLLEMMRWTCLLAQDHPHDGKTFEDPKIRRRFAQAALIASDLWGNRAYDGKIESTGNAPGDLRRAMAAIRQGVAANASAVELMPVLGRVCKPLPSPCSASTLGPEMRKIQKSSPLARGFCGHALARGFEALQILDGHHRQSAEARP